MPPKPEAPKLSTSGYIEDRRSGLLIPNPRSLSASRAIDQVSREWTQQTAIDGNGFAAGMRLERDPDNLIVHWAGKGSGWDDFTNQSIVDGNLANVGLSPVVAPQISAMVGRQMKQAITATIDLTGRSLPVTKAKEAISRFNDSPLGATEALQRIVYGLCTYNRGSPIASVPITYALDKWPDFGLTAVPLLRPPTGKERTPKKTELYYLEVDWAKHGTPVPFLPSVFDLEPSGIAEWPYWYRSVDEKNVSRWVLLHQTHILEFTPGVSSARGLGTSAVWMCLGVLAEQILVLEERAEKAAYAMTDGITILGGVEARTGDDILAKIKSSHMQSMTEGFVVAKNQTILTSPMADRVSIAQVSFRQNMTDFQKWREYVEDVIATCFGVTLSELVIRGGVGYGAQADAGSENSADSGTSAILFALSMALGAIYPRVQISISRPNDRAQRMNIKTLVDFSIASDKMIKNGVYTNQEARSIIHRDILRIPVIAADTVTTSANTDEGDQDLQPAAGGPAPTEQPQPAPTNGNGNGNGNKNGNGNGNDSGTKVAAAARNRKLPPGVLYRDTELTITEADVDLSIRRSGQRIDGQLEEMLTALPVEE